MLRAVKNCRLESKWFIGYFYFSTLTPWVMEKILQMESNRVEKILFEINFPSNKGYMELDSD